MKPSEDFKIWTFRLRKTARWSNGEARDGKVFRAFLETTAAMHGEKSRIENCCATSSV
jgi:ABC-type oligopeptide transport system substrate-binding subunit